MTAACAACLGSEQHCAALALPAEQFGPQGQHVGTSDAEVAHRAGSSRFRMTLKYFFSESLFGFQPCTCQENQVVRRLPSVSPGIGFASFEACGVDPLASRNPAGST